MIRTERLTKRFRHQDALLDLTMAVPPGSVFALVGPNGAGKSTAIKIFMNLMRPSAGRAEVMGVDSTRIGATELAQIGYVSENQKLPEWMRLDYFLDYCRAFYPSWDPALATELIRSFELPLDRRLRAFSRGMKMKAALAVSLAYRPRLIVLDEPFSGLDILVREQLIRSIVDATPEATILLASHDLSEIESFATHVAYLNEGRLEFVEEMEALSVRFREIEVTLDAPSSLLPSLPSTWLGPELNGAFVRFTDTHYEPARSREEVARRFPGVRDIQSRKMSLASIFLALAKSRRAQCT
jgi:ABC-2 type transport system ATP-binding protein